MFLESIHIITSSLLVTRLVCLRRSIFFFHFRKGKQTEVERVMSSEILVSYPKSVKKPLISVSLNENIAENIKSNFSLHLPPSLFSLARNGIDHEPKNYRELQKNVEYQLTVKPFTIGM
jgi:hypothetical protein